MGFGYVFCVQRVPFDAVQQIHDLVKSANINVVAQDASVGEFHAYTWSKIEPVVGPVQPPRSQQPITAHASASETALWSSRTLNRIILHDPRISPRPQGALHHFAGWAEAFLRRYRVTPVFTVLGVLVAATAVAQTPPPTRASIPAAITEPVLPSFNHSLFDGLLRAHVKDGLVDYAAFKNNADFTRYLASLQEANLKGLEEAERIAFWLNTYNAYTIQLVASRGETESIRNINKSFGLFRLKGPWSEDFVLAAGQTLTLDDVEHRILRHDFSEPRVHFAMNLAAKGGPKMRSEAYTGLKLDDQLEQQTRGFLHESTKNRLDTTQHIVYISPVVARYRDDFGASNNALGKFLADYYPGPERQMLLPRRDVDPGLARLRADTLNGKKLDTARINNRVRRQQFVYFRVTETPFDWALNIQRRP